MKSVDINNLPDDSAALKNIIINYHDKFNEYQKENNSLKAKHEEATLHYEREMQYLKTKLEIFTARFFRRTSEKLSQEDMLQMRMFNEAEASEESKESAKVESKEKIVVKTFSRKRGGRKPIPEYVPRVEVVHDISEDEKKCACGAELTRIGEEISEKIDIIPPRIQAIKHIRPKYACRSCEGVESEGEKSVKIAPMPAQMIPGCMATSGTLAYIATGKFCDAMPFYRQAKIVNRFGIDIPRADFSNWMIRTSDGMDDLWDIMVKDIRRSYILGIDETRLQVLREEGRKNTAESYMWVMRGMNDGKVAIMFEYSTSKSVDAIEKYVEGYKGIIQTDGYNGFDRFDKITGITHAGCWAHVRRDFFDVTKTSGAPPETNTALSYMTRLYAIEKEARESNLSPEEIKKLRQDKAKPIVEKFREWIDVKVHHIPPKSPLGKAIKYALGEWPKLLVYLDDGRIPIDNNFVENAIRPFVVGRKNWLFMGSPRGACASARLYSIIETAKANGLDPYWYLRYLFEKLPQAKSTELVRSLLPYNVTREMIMQL
jgi:transposase